MATTYGISLKRLHNIDGTNFETEVGPFTFEVFKTEYGVIQWVVKIHIKGTETSGGVIWLSYLADEFGGYESEEKAKRAVETYVANVLHIND